MVSGSARNVFDTKPPNVADAHSGDEQDEEREAEAARCFDVTGSRGRITEHILQRCAGHAKSPLPRAAEADRRRR